MLRRLPLLLTLLLFAGSACDDETPTQDQKCGGDVVRRCHWNPATMRYDLDCVYFPADAGPAACDGGVSDAPASN